MNQTLPKIIILACTIVFALGCNDKNESLRIQTTTDTTIEKNIIVEKNDNNTTEIKKEVDTEPTPYPDVKIQRSSSIANIDNIKNFDFNLIKKGYEDDNTLLIVGGIQGDEPGGFMAASLIVTHYEITKGSVWVVPNLNFYSIIKRSRGPYGDMNRKFSKLSQDDPEYETVKRIKGYINNDNIKLVVNLHDGSGYYRPNYVDAQHSPNKWGQCSIIDQETINDHQYSNLFKISNTVVKHVNENLIDNEHKYHLHNTRTREGDKEMEKTLTYYAINQGKAAFGNEASKNLPTHQRSYYHLLALEKYMDTMGIEYKRKFDLKEQDVKDILDNDIKISLYNNKIQLPLSQIRDILNYVPVKKDGTIDFVPSNPLMSIVKQGDEYSIYYGNRRLTRLMADYMDYELKNDEIDIKLDNKLQKVPFGSVITVNKDFKVLSGANYRVNVIGYTNKKNIETDVTIDQSKIMKKFSIDKNGSIYRIEFYSKEKFAGMILVKFAG